MFIVTCVASVSLSFFCIAAKILGRGTGTIGGGGAGDIWTHDQSSPIAVDSQVAALVDANSIPKMWIQATIMAFRPGVVSSRTRERLLKKIVYFSTNDCTTPHSSGGGFFDVLICSLLSLIVFAFFVYL